MGDQTSGGLENRILPTARSIAISFLLGVIVNRYSDVLPSVNQVIEASESVIQMWTDLASIDSPETYALNAVVLTTVTSALLNSWNRDSASPTISDIFTTPGVAFWSKWLVKRMDMRLVGPLAYSFAGAARIYLWVGLMFSFIIYAVLYVQNSEAYLFVVSSSAILAGATFGAVFGRFEKGLVLSMKSTSRAIRKGNIQGHSRWWAIMIPVSVILAFYVTYRKYSSLNNPNFGEFLSSLTSVFLTTILSVIAIFYLLAVLVMGISVCSEFFSSYRNGDWTFKKKLGKWLKEKYKKESKNKNKSQTGYGYPDEVAEVLRMNDER